MASHRTCTAGATTAPAAQSPGTHASARDATPASGGRDLTRVAWDARVSTDKQEREETIASQVDLLQQNDRSVRWRGVGDRVGAPSVPVHRLPCLKVVART